MDPETTGAPKSKKALYIVIGVIVLIILGTLFRGTGSHSGVAGVEMAKDGATGATTYSNEDGSVTVGTNKLPDNWPSDAPTYSNATIQYSASSNPQTGEAGSAVVFQTGDSVTTVLDFYKKELASKGWTIEQTANMGTATVLAAKKGERTFGVYIADGGDGKVTVTVGLSDGKAN